MKVQLNVIGPQLQKTRLGQGLTQDQLSAKCQLLGFDVTRGTLAKIESGVRSVSDHEVPFLAKALGVPIAELFPSKLKPLFRKPRNASGTRKHKG